MTTDADYDPDDVPVTDDQYSELYSDYKSLEQSYMCLKEEYSEVARALGFEAAGLWGDPNETHAQIVDRATEVMAICIAEGLFPELEDNF